MITSLFFIFWLIPGIIYYILLSKISITLAILVGVIGGFISSWLILLILLILLMPIMKYTSPNNKFKYLLVKSASRFVNNFILNIKVEAYGLENLTKNNNLTIYANHKSNADPLILAHNTNRAIAFTPKISLYRIPILSNYFNYIGCLPIDREDNRRTARTLVKAIKNVKEGLAMVVFPEGGIKDRSNEKMVDIKAGAYKIGMKAESDFLPVSIIGASQIKDKKFFQRKTIKVIYHPVVKYEDVKDLTTVELSEKMFDIINSKIE